MGTMEWDRDTATAVLGWDGGIRSLMLSPDEVSEAPVQVHGGGGAAEHREDAFQVQKLQLLAVTVEAQRRPHIKAGKKREVALGPNPDKLQASPEGMHSRGHR